MIQITIISLFTSIILLEEISISTRIKLALKISIRKQIKLLDCFPCFTFWISLIFTLTLHESILTPMVVFIIAKFYNAWKLNS